MAEPSAAGRNCRGRAALSAVVQPRPRSAFRSVVAVPAKDERDHLPRCLMALAGGTVLPHAAFVLLNNCRDDSAAVVAALDLPFDVAARSVTLAPSLAHAGWARRLAMDGAADLAGAAGVVLCTDADAMPTRGWLAANLREIAAGADAVAGMAELHPGEEDLIPPALRDDDARECAYAAQLNEMDWLLDADPADPWPRHDQHSGASIAVTVRAYRAAGGVPPLRLGEDRGLFDALRRIDARIRHAPDVVVTVSARTEGRAAGGMADTIRRRMTCPDAELDARLEPAADAFRRASLRRATRSAWRGRSPFGAEWERIERRDPSLLRRRVHVNDLAAEAAAAERLLAGLRLSGSADRADTRPSVQPTPA